MIQVKHIAKVVETHSCDNCNRVTSFVLEYRFHDKKGKEFNKLTLCEDCANAVSNLLHLSMEDGKSFMYDYDEIKEVEGI